MSYGELLQSALGQGMTLARAMEMLRGSGASPLEAACALQDATGRGADEARAVVSESGAWSGPRPGLSAAARAGEWNGAIGQHGRSGHGASSVLPHLWRPAARTTNRPSR